MTVAVLRTGPVLVDRRRQWTADRRERHAAQQQQLRVGRMDRAARSDVPGPRARGGVRMRSLPPASSVRPGVHASQHLVGRVVGSSVFDRWFWLDLAAHVLQCRRPVHHLCLGLEPTR